MINRMFGLVDSEESFVEFVQEANPMAKADR
jgi:hypothetical protein